MLLNVSNHPHASWSDRQLKAARMYGNIVDLPFPVVSPAATETEIHSLANRLFIDIVKLRVQTLNPITVHLMGEMTLTYTLVYQLHQAKIPCIASTTERRVTMKGNSKKTTFKFIQFRPYFLSLEVA